MPVDSKFHTKIKADHPCIGTVISYADPTVSETLCQTFDFLWIDMEHSPLTLKDVQGHQGIRKKHAVRQGEHREGLPEIYGKYFLHRMR